MHSEGTVVRPVEALHLLSLVTRHAYCDDDLHDVYAWWGLLKYLGFFDHDASGQETPALRVSRSGARVIGAQRRVASEELGIAFGVLVATDRFRDELGPGVPVGIIDVDLMMHGSGQGSSRRPDYALVASPCGYSKQGQACFLECMGTSDPADSEGQLVKAVSQIADPILGYSAPGLAVSTVTGPGQVSYVALELTREEGEREAPDPKPRRRALAGAGRDFIQAGLRSSWSMLGYYAGNRSAVQQWSDDRKVGMLPAYWGEREVIESELGDAIGITRTFDLGDRQLIITWAVDSEVDAALTRGDPENVLTTQEGFAGRLDGIGDEPGSADDELEKPADLAGAVDQLVPGSTVESAMPDGSILSLTVR